jgi:hypothetical protein
MKKSKLLPLFIIAALFTSSCENMSPGENAAVAGGVAGAVTGGVLALAGVDSAITIPVAAGAALLAGGAAYIVSKQQATKRQEQIALENARAAEARLLAQQKKSSSQSGSSYTAKKKSTPKYIAVDTVASEKSPSKSKQVMIYDTESKQIVGNSVYNLGRQPQPGSSAKYDMMTAQYVGR